MPATGWKHKPESVELMRARNRERQEPLAERFHRNIEFDTNGGCWLWSGAMPTKTGYGTVQHNGKTLTAHRLAYEFYKGPIRAGGYVLHGCDVRACVNPAHLRVGTPLDNIIDTIVRGRRRVRHGDQHRGAKIKSTDVPVIRGRLLAGESCKAIAKSYGVTDCAINALRRGRSWAHVLGVVLGDADDRGEASASPRRERVA